MSSCACCDPGAPATPLEVENRPGLTAIAYRIGSYAGFRRAMLEEIARTPELAALATRRSDDYAITILELWAAVADVLTFYQERYANEAFLRPATRRESIARLARLIDYGLRPGVAAVARLAFTAERAKTVRMPVGSRVVSVPGQDERPQTFETLEEIVADARLNRLRALPAPVASNPLAKGSLGAWLEPGEDGVEAGARLAPGDRVVLVRTGSLGEIEELTLAELRAEDDRVRAAWTLPVQGGAWDVTTAAFEFSRTFRVFGHNAPAKVMTPASDATLAGGIRWTLGTTPTHHPSGSTISLDGRYGDVKVGARVLLAVAGGAVRLLTVTGVAQTQETVGPQTDTVTQLTVSPAIPSSFDRRKSVVYELAGGRIGFWGYDYPPTLRGGTVLVPGRALPDGRIEVGRAVIRNELQPGVELGLDEIEPKRAVLLADDGGAPPVPATVREARIVGEDVSFASTPDDSTTAGELGLDAGSAVRATGLVSGELPSTLALTHLTGQVELSIGAVGPVTVPVTFTAGSAVTRTTAAARLEHGITHAGTAPELTSARVLTVEGRLLVLPGVVGAQVRIAATAADPTTAPELALDGATARSVSGLLSAALPAAPTLTSPVRRLSAQIGPSARRTLTLAGAPTSRSAARALLEVVLRQADAAPSFAHGRVLLVGDRLLVLPGLIGAAHADYLALDLEPEGDVALDARTAVALGNVALASHGETVRDEAVGNGDASARFQRFALARTPLTFTPGSGAGGVASSLTVLVNGVRWNEVDSLYDRPPDDRVYVTRQDEEGATIVQFGDGRTGAPLPTGVSNVRAAYRYGAGLEGRVGEGSLTNALDRPTGLLSVANPLAAEGGADPETIEDARRNAPQTVRTFGRVVSVRDFEDVVRASGEVAKARATAVARKVHVTVAGQAGGTFSAEALGRLKASLDTARDPNFDLEVGNYVAVPIRVRATVDVEPDHVRADVLAAARAALLGALAFDALELGRSVALSDVFRTLQDVTGVRSVDVDELSFKSATDLAARGVTFLADGSPAPVQARLHVFPAELATVESPPHDVTVAATGGLT